jgi:hypothetical protein
LAAVVAVGLAENGLAVVLLLRRAAARLVVLEAGQSFGFLRLCLALLRQLRSAQVVRAALLRRQMIQMEVQERQEIIRLLDLGLLQDLGDLEMVDQLQLLAAGMVEEDWENVI